MLVQLNLIEMHKTLHLGRHDFQDKKMVKNMKIGIVGLGFVGLSLTSVLASKGYNTVGIDIDKEKCNKICNGDLPFFEPDLEKTLKNGFKKKLTISNDFSLIKDCEIIFVAVGTPQKSNGSIELSIRPIA